MNMDILGLMKNMRYISSLYQQINSLLNYPWQNITVSNCPVQNMTDAKLKRQAETCWNQKYKVGYMFTSYLVFVQIDIYPFLFGKQAKWPQFGGTDQENSIVTACIAIWK